MTAFRNTQTIECQHIRFNNNCQTCGVFLSEEFQAYKTYLYQSDQSTSGKRNLKSIKKGLKKFEIMKQRFTYSEAIFNFLEKIVTKFQFSIQTLALGVYIYNILIKKKNINRIYIAQMEFYSSVCLMVAAKAIELDKNIPYYSRYQRYAQKSHQKQQYQKIQTQIFEQFQFDLQIPTFATIISFYLSNGILFSNDKYNKNNVFLLQHKVKQIMIKYIKNGQFVTQDQQKLASKIIYSARKQCNLKWNPLIQQYSLLPLSRFQQPQILKQINIHHSFTTLPSISKNFHINRSLKKSCSSRKIDNILKQTIQKTNSIKSFKQIPVINGLHFKSLDKVQ